MAKYIDMDKLLEDIEHSVVFTVRPDKPSAELRGARKIIDRIQCAPAADVVEEENILKFYYVRSIDEYWIGQRIDNFYYAEYDPKIRQWVWAHSRYLPWGEHVVSPTSLWKEHTYPSEPEEMPFGEWLTGFIKKHIAVDGTKARYGEWVKKNSNPLDGEYSCSACGSEYDFGDGDVTPIDDFYWFYCPNCGAKMDGGADDAAG